MRDQRMGNPLAAAGGPYLDRPLDKESSLSGGFRALEVFLHCASGLSCPLLRQGEGPGMPVSSQGTVDA
jgi:hypothetical protein